MTSRIRLLALPLVVGGLLLAGCTVSVQSGAGPSEQVSSVGTTSSGPPRCLPDVGDPEIIDIQFPNGPRLSAVVAGEEPRGLVLVHGSAPDGRCSWERQIPILVGLGFSILAFDHACVADSDCPGDMVDLVADIGAGVTALSDRGATAVGVIGVSLGTVETVVSAASPDFDVDAVVALSPTRPSTDVRPPGAPEPRNPAAAVAVTDVPILFVTSVDDRASQVADAELLYAATADRRSQLIVVPGAAHAQGLLYPPGVEPGAPPSGEVFEGVLAFLDLFLIP